MQALKDVSLRWKLLAPLAIIALVLVTMAVITISGTTRIAGETEAIAERHLPGVNYLVQADRDLYQALVAERSMIFVESGDAGFDKLRQQHAENVQQARERVGKFAALNQSPEVTSKIKAYEGLRDRWEQLTAQVVAQRLTDTPEGRAEAVCSRGG